MKIVSVGLVCNWKDVARRCLGVLIWILVGEGQGSASRVEESVAWVHVNEVRQRWEGTYNSTETDDLL